jgi:flagellar hook-associated protein 2
VATTSGIGTLSSPGVGSGLDVNSIVSQLMTIERQPITDLQKQETKYQSQLSAFGQVKSALATFQTAVQSLSNPAKFKVFAATVSDSSVLSATINSSASPASYQIETTQLAQQHKISSGAFASMNDVVGTGDLTLQFGTYDGTAGTFTPNGSKAAATINISASNNTLTGVRDAINAANAGVSASIINDGSGYRLVITSKDSGAANSIKITAADGDGNNTDASGLSALAYDPTATSGSGKNLAQVAEARNALFTIDGIAISKASNTVTDAIQGVTLKLTQKNVGQPVTVDIAQDTKSISDAVQGFVKVYNDARKVLKDLSAYDAQAQKASVLTGDSTVRSIGSQLKSFLTGSVGSTLSTLSTIGVSFQQDGTLAVDSTKLQNALDTNFSAIAPLFAANGAIADNQINLVSSTDKTQEGSYAVNISALPTHGQLTGSQPAGLVISAGVNDQLTLQVDGTSATVTLSPGTYASAAALATEVQARVNGVAGVSVSVSQSAGILNIVSASYGTGSSISISGGNCASNLFGAAPASQTGQDVSGTINGAPAIGHGQVLTASSGSPAEGLSLFIAGGAVGPRGSLNFTEGIAKRLDQYLTGVLGTTGNLVARTDGINSSIKRLTDRQADLESRMSLIEKRYRSQFTALDAMISSMNSTSTFLTQQLASLSNLNSNK